MSNLPPGVTQRQIDSHYGFDGPEPDDDEDDEQDEEEDKE